MGVIPRMKRCCFCYSLKTGSFTIALLLLVGSSVQTGYYAFLINHSKPTEICTYQYFTQHRVQVYEVLPTDDEVGFWSPFFSPFDYYSEFSESQLYSSRADNHPRGSVRGQMDRSTPTTKKPPKRITAKWVLRKVPHSFSEPCRKPFRMPFDVDVTFLNFNFNGPFNKDILYFNLCVFGTMMCFTPLLIYAVYKESRGVLLFWLVAETTLLSAAVAGTVVASIGFLKVLQVSVGVVTLVNMAFHLAIDIYFVMVVYNFREKLDVNNEEETEEIQV